MSFPFLGIYFALSCPWAVVEDMQWGANFGYGEPEIVEKPNAEVH